ncbi:hypothetical protein KDM88_12915, partial [Undibacterium sp. BYS50W]|nr:hypothetical protein [Undibacterium rugosum]
MFSKYKLEQFSPSQSSKGGVIRLTLFFIFIVCITILMLDGWRSWSSREIQLREAEVSTANMARAISQHADDTI